MRKKILTMLTCGMLAISMSMGMVQPVAVFADDWDDWDDWDGLYYDSDDDFEAMVIYGSMLDEEARRLDEQRKKQEKERKRLEKERERLEEERRRNNTSYGVANSSNVRVNGILVSTNVLNLEVGQVSQVGVQVVPENASNRGMSLYSSNPAVAVVDMYANVRAVGPGTAVINAVTNDGGYVQQIYVNVVSYPMAKLSTP